MIDIHSAPASKSVSARNTHWFGLGLRVAVATGVGMGCLACKLVWFDESFSVEVARIDWRNFLHLLWWREANMSLYYVLLRGWLHFGQSPFFIRSLSALISAATLPAVYWLARLLYDRRVALIAAALFAFNAYDVRYAQEARSYSLFVLLATLSSGLLILFLREPTRQHRAGYVLCSVLAVYAHLYALLLIAAHWMALRWSGQPAGGQESIVPVARHMRRVWWSMGIAVLPLLVFVGKTGAGPIRWIQRPGPRDMIAFFEHLAGSYSWPLPALCLAAIVLAVGRHLWTRDRTWEVWRAQFLLIWLLFPIVLTVLLSFARPVFLPRYMIFCLPPLVILVAAGVARLRQAWLRAPVLAIFLLFGLQGTFYVYAHDFDDERDASGAAANFILDHAQPGDAVLFHIAETRVPYEFFRSLRAGENTASPDFAAALGPAILFPRHEQGLDYRDFTGKPTADFVRNSAPAYSRVWIMLMNNGTPERPDPTTMTLGQVLPGSFPRVERWQFARVEVRLYSRE